MNGDRARAAQHLIAGLGEVIDFVSAQALTIPADTGMPRVVITTEHAHDVTTFASRHLVGAAVDRDGRVFVELHFAAAVLHVRAERTTP